MRQPKQFFVYIMPNSERSAVLYTGITGNLRHRVWQLKSELIPGFTGRYNLTRLVYYELFISRRRHRPRKTNQGLAAQQEN